MKKSLVKPRTGLVAALDIGSSKVCCFIARLGEGPRGSIRPQVVGIGHQVSRGVRAGVIVDMEAVDTSIRAAVAVAEKMASQTLSGVIVNLSGGYPASQTIGVEVSIAGHEVGDGDMRKVLHQWRQIEQPADRSLIHSIPVGFSIDGTRGIRDPRGMFGERLGASMHVVTAASGAVRTLATTISRCHLDVEHLVVSPYASGLAALVEDEMDLGVTVIDMGGGTTTIAVFFDGNVVYTDCVPLGGQHVTSDLARGLSTPLVDAERIKTLYGSAVASPLDAREMVHVPLVGEEDRDTPRQVPRSLLTGIIQPRLEETFEMVRSRLEASGFDKIAGRRVVLTGGASQLQGVRDLAQLVLDKQVRTGRPMRIAGLAEATSGPAFSTCAGLLVYAANPILDATRQPAPETAPAGMFGRIGSWLRENF